MTPGPRVLTTGQLPGERPSVYTPVSLTLLLDTFVLDMSLIDVSKFMLHYHQWHFKDGILMFFKNLFLLNVAV